MRATLIVSLVLIHTGLFAVQTQDLTYKASDGTSCVTDMGVRVKMPEGNGPFPVHVHLVGTFANYLTAEAVPMQNEMVARGFLTASVEWDSTTPYNCATVVNKAQCAFDAGSADSAISKICALPQADCTNLGLIVSGMSQGGQIAYLSKNYDSRVRALLTMSSGNERTTPTEDFSSCLNPGSRQLALDRLRVVSGENDIIYGATTNGVRAQLEGLTSRTCGATAYSCLQSNGSGWYMVKNSQVQDGNADHCYMFASGCGDAATSTMDPGWAAPSTTPWSMRAGLSWLSGFTTGGTSTTGPTELLEAYAYPNPAVAPANPTLRVVLPAVDSVEVTIFDITGRSVHSITLPATPLASTTGGGQVYEYTWSGPKASGVYFAVVHGRNASGVIKARIKFSVVK